MKRILFITDNYFPENCAPALRIKANAEYLAQEKYIVTVITTCPNFPSGIPISPFKNKIFSTQKMNDVKIVRVWSYMAKNEGILLRSIDFFSFFITSFLASLFIKFDLVYTTSPQFFTNLSGLCIKYLRKNKIWIAEIRDMWPDSIKVVMGITSESWIIKTLSKLEKKTYLNANFVIPVSKNFIMNIKEKEPKTLFGPVIYNGFDENIFTNKVEKKKISSHEVVKLVYIGNFGSAQDLQTVIEGVCLANKNLGIKIFLDLYGQGIMLDNIREYLKKNKITFIKIFSSINHISVCETYHKYDAAIVPLDKDSLYDDVIPSKIFEIIGSNLWTISSVRGEALSILRDYGRFISYRPNDKFSFEEAIKVFQLSNNRNFSDTKKNKQMRIKYSRKFQAKKLKLFLDHI
jgi:hypothetical protein